MSQRFIMLPFHQAGAKAGIDKAKRYMARLANRFTPRRKDHTVIKLNDWKARRSGASITITGKDEAGNARKITTQAIDARKGKPPLAVTSDGMQYELA